MSRLAQAAVARWLMLRPRSILAVAVVLVLACAFVAAKPTLIIPIEVAVAQLPRLVHPYEYTAVLVALVTAGALAPRLLHLEATGTGRVTVLAVCCTAATLLIPLVVTVVGLLTYPPWGRPGASYLIPLLNNVLFMAAVAAIAVGLTGRLTGTVISLTVYGGLLYFQAARPEWTAYLPLLGAYDPTGLLDRTWRWGWLTIAVAAALAVAITRRNLPLRALL